MPDCLEWSLILVPCDCDSCSSAPHPGQCSNVPCGYSWNLDPVTTYHHTDLLNTLGFAGSTRPNCLSLLYCARIHSSDCYLACMGVHPNLGYHEGKRSIRIAIDHGLAYFRVKIALPDIRYPIFLSNQGGWEFFYCHVE